MRYPCATMIRLARHPSRLPHALRVAVWLLLAMGMVLQPVMAAAGELHELAHDPSGSHNHAPHASAADGGQDVMVAPESQESPTLHLLLDLSHCCGGAAAMSPLQRILAVMPADCEGPAGSTATIPPQVRLPSPFKPPIIG